MIVAISLPFVARTFATNKYRSTVIVTISLPFIAGKLIYRSVS
jgi:hypothetical protein